MPRLQTADPASVVVDAAAGLFAQHGTAKVSIQDVASAVGVTKAAVLHHFGSREALVHAVNDAARALVTESTAAVRELEEGESRDVLAIRTLLDCALRHRGVVAFATAHGHAQEIDAHRLAMHAFDDLPGAVPRDRAVAVLAVLATIGAASLDAHRDGDVEAWRPEIETICRRILHGTVTDTEHEE